ncbi:MAG: hypothetical protein Kow0029_20780 [Candidatus Rifleibacteriota bacterium]
MITLPETGFVRLSQILKVIPICKATFYNGLRSGRFNIKPIKNGRCTFFRVEDVRALIDELTGGAQ